MIDRGLCDDLATVFAARHGGGAVTSRLNDPAEQQEVVARALALPAAEFAEIVALADNEPLRSWLRSLT